MAARPRRDRHGALQRGNADRVPARVSIPYWVAASLSGAAGGRALVPAGVGSRRDPASVLAQGDEELSSRSVASGRHRNRNGAYLLVPSPGETCTYASPTRDNPRASTFGMCELVTIAPSTGRRTWPPCVWPATM